MLRIRCPRADELKAIAAGGSASDRARKHVERCETCAQIVANLRNDSEFVDKLRRAAELRLDEKTRERVIEICERAVVDAKSGV